MPETNAERLAHIQYQINDARLHGGMYSSTHVELEWLIEQAERALELETIVAGQMIVIGGLRNKNKLLREAFNKFELAMESEIDWQIKNSKSDRRAQFQNGALNGMRNIERQWKVACQELKGGVQHEDTHKT